jgi:hypothetical protein
MLCFGSLALADDFKTIDGKEYKNATVSRVEPDGLVITFSLAKILSSPKFLRNAKEGPHEKETCRACISAGKSFTHGGGICA